MILLADSGATKAAWSWIENGQVKEQETTGLNPYFYSPDDIAGLLGRELMPYLQRQEVQALWFYGAGCGAVEQQRAMQQTLRQVFGHATDIFVADDLLAAARALCQGQPGTACILGTGSNVCVSDGHEITRRAVSLGVWLGDEGSGAHIGKTLITAYMLGELPAELHEAFEQEYPHERYAHILEQVYRRPAPNRYLGQFARFVHRHLGHPAMQALATDCIGQFWDRMVARTVPDQALPVHFTGSVAWYFEALVRAEGAERGWQTGHILQAPIEGLRRYHEISGHHSPDSR